ncbi:hypothetical protein C0584_03700 [Candidatus Parcubacteria bacterium]|nr:MAG: hypothetical protein C0584_03700 [Candidatus Parcubacteria bacterium]
MKEKLIFEKSSSKHLQFVEEVKILIDREARKDNMVYQTEEALSEQIMNEDAVLVFSESRLVGYICLEYWKNYIEIGGLVVDPEYRESGIGYQLTVEVIELALSKKSDKEIIILANSVSCLIPKKIGFVVKEKNYFHSEVWELCEMCESRHKFPDCRCVGLVYPV